MVVMVDVQHLLPAAFAPAVPAPSPLSPDTWVARSLASFESLLTCHLLGEIYLSYRT